MRLEAISRLKIILEKTKLISIGRVANVKDLALELGCRIGKLLTSYLGLPLGGPLRAKIVCWDTME